MNTTRLLDSLKAWARRLKVDAGTLYFAARDPRVPWPAKLAAAAVAAYAFSPIDLIPDFIPVMGLLDEVVIVPLGIALTLRLVPPEILADCRTRAAALAERPISRAAAAVVIAAWGIVALLIIAAVFDEFA